MAPRNAAGQAAKAQRRKENIPWRLGGRPIYRRQAA